MSDLRPTASEVVLIHALRFVEPRAGGATVPGRDASVSARTLGRVLLGAAVVSVQHEQWIDLAFSDVPRLMGLLHKRELIATPGVSVSDVPESTLEARVVATVATGTTQRCPLEWALRHSLARPGDPRPDPVAIVRTAARARCILLAGDRPVDHPGLATAAADRIHTLVADLRERDPELWLAIQRAIEGAIVPWIPAGLRGLSPRMFRRRREATHHDLRDWERLNRNPPRAG